MDAHSLVYQPANGIYIHSENFDLISFAKNFFPHLFLYFFFFLNFYLRFFLLLFYGVYFTVSMLKKHIVTCLTDREIEFLTLFVQKDTNAS